MYVALLAAALFVGCLLAVQTSVNLQLNGAMKTPYGASTVQLAIAAGLLAVVALAVGTIGAVSLVPDVPWWQLLGGLASPLYITSGILLFPRIGALAAVGLFVTGQMFASLALDLTGSLGIPQQAISPGIVIGALTVIAGITVIIRQRPAATAAAKPAAQPVGAMATQAPASAAGGPGAGAAAPALPPAPVSAGGRASGVAWVVLGVIAGAVLPIQGAINANLRNELDAPITVGMVSFIVSTLSIGLVLLALLALRRTPTPQFRPLAAMPWWGWLGGACAATYVTVTFLLIPEIGAATTVAVTVTGQQLFSAVIDTFGLFRMPRRALSARRITGLVLLVVGSVLIQLT